MTTAWGDYASLWLVLGAAFLALLVWLSVRLRRSAQRLQAETEKWRTFAAVSLDGILIHDRLVALEVNDEFGRIFGYPRDELIGTDVTRFIAPRSRALVQERMQARYSGRYGIYGLRQDGSQFPMEVASQEMTYQGRKVRAVAVRDISAYREQQQVLGQLSSVVEQSPVAVFILDLQARVEWTNPAFTVLTGYAENSLKGRKIAAILAESEQHQETLNWTALEKEALWQCDTLARRQDDTRFRARVSIFSTFSPSGSVAGYAGVIEDISDQLEQQAALTRSRRTLAMAERLSHVAHWSWDVLQDKIHWSEEMYRITGLKADEFAHDQAGFMARIYPADRALVERHVQRCLEEKVALEFEYRLVRPDGQIRDQYSINEPVLDADGEVLRLVGTNQDITERKRAEQTVFKLAFTDPLTGLPNRNRLVDQLRILVQQGQDDICQALLLINLDNFKAFNDNYGRAVGDQLLKHVGLRLKALCHGDDLLARLNGDEFAIFRPALQRSGEVNTVIASVLATCHVPYVLGHGSYQAALTVGATILTGSVSDVSEIMRQTDLALHHAKLKQAGGFKVYNPLLDRQLKAHTQLVDELARAIDEDQLFLEYQPQIEIAQGQIIGLEALVRWQHPTEGRIPPGRFISVAEESGLIGRLGVWVLKEASRQVRIWLDDDIAPGHVAVNLSPRQFADADLGDQIVDITRAANVPPQRIELELTESTEMAFSAGYQAILEHLQKHGFRFSIDDFGTGYSSMQYLRRLPVYKIKIAQEFVRDMLDDVADMEIVRATIAIARSFKLEVIAEGVETVEHANRVRKLGCEQIQGYLYSRPVSAKLAAKMLKAGSIRIDGASGETVSQS